MKALLTALSVASAVTVAQPAQALSKSDIIATFGEILAISAKCGGEYEFNFEYLARLADEVGLTMSDMDDVKVEKERRAESHSEVPTSSFCSLMYANSFGPGTEPDRMARQKFGTWLMRRK